MNIDHIDITIKSLKDPATDEACADDEKFRNPDCITTTVSWEAPSLNVAMYRYPIRKHDADNQFLSSCRLEEQSTTPDCRSQVYEQAGFADTVRANEAHHAPGWHQQIKLLSH